MSQGKKLKYDRLHLHFSKEQKNKVVQEIESGQLTRNEAMEKYYIVGHHTLNSWLLQLGSNPEGVVRKRYMKADQRLAAYKIITGESALDEVARAMQVAHDTISRWVRRYKKDVHQNPISSTKKKPHLEVIGQDKPQQKELEELRLKVAGLEMMIDIAEELKVDIRKKSGTKL